MFARIATFEGGDVERLRQMNEERMASGDMSPPAGMRRAMLLQGDRRLFITFFDSREQIDASIAKLGYPAPSVEKGPAAFLTSYGRWVYLPGPVLAAGLGLALGGLILSRGRDQGTLLFTASAIAILLPPAMFATFDWRYQLPQLSLIPVAAVLGSHAIVRRRSATRAPRS